MVKDRGPCFDPYSRKEDDGTSKAHNRRRGRRNDGCVVGRESWELDALEPEVIGDLIRKAVRRRRNHKKWEDSKQAQELQRNKLKKLATALTED